MSRKTFVLCLGAMLLSVQLPALALGGCADSPENPTAVLALLGAAVGGTRYALKKFGSRRKLLSDASKAA
jgi:hypothetical protein